MENKTEVIKGYLISNDIKEILKKEGFVALRIAEKPADSLKICEALKLKNTQEITANNKTIISAGMVRVYNDRLLVIEDTIKE